MTWQSFFFGHHWQSLTIIDIFLDGFKSWNTIFGRMNIQDLYHILGGFNHLQKLNISENQRMNIRCRTAALPQDVRAGWRAHRGLVGCICRSAELRKLMAAEGNIIPLYIPQKIPICSMVKSWIGHIKWDGQASPFPTGI
jgi:hypothetical protein